MNMWTAHFKNGDTLIFKGSKDDVRRFMDRLDAIEFQTRTGKALYLDRDNILYIDEKVSY